MRRFPGLADDLRHALALRDIRARDNAAARKRAMANEELRATLMAGARRRGRGAVDWTEYFRSVDINYP